jgi:hypothetical protein
VWGGGWGKLSEQGRVPGGDLETAEGRKLKLRKGVGQQEDAFHEGRTPGQRAPGGRMVLDLQKGSVAGLNEAEEE